jgi:hypothetical protein
MYSALKCVWNHNRQDELKSQTNCPNWDPCPCLFQSRSFPNCLILSWLWRNGHITQWACPVCKTQAFCTDEFVDAKILAVECTKCAIFWVICWQGMRLAQTSRCRGLPRSVAAIVVHDFWRKGFTLGAVPFGSTRACPKSIHQDKFKPALCPYLQNRDNKSISTKSLTRQNR